MGSIEKILKLEKFLSNKLLVIDNDLSPIFEPISIMLKKKNSLLYLNMHSSIDLTTCCWNEPNKKIDKSIPSEISKFHFIDFLLTIIFFLNPKKISVLNIILAIIILEIVFRTYFILIKSLII